MMAIDRDNLKAHYFTRPADVIQSVITIVFALILHLNILVYLCLVIEWTLERGKRRRIELIESPEYSMFF
jgi:hypothetical protein